MSPHTTHTDGRDWRCNGIVCSQRGLSSFRVLSRHTDRRDMRNIGKMWKKRKHKITNVCTFVREFTCANSLLFVVVLRSLRPCPEKDWLEGRASESTRMQITRDSERERERECTFAECEYRQWSDSHLIDLYGSRDVISTVDSEDWAFSKEQRNARG